MVLSIFCELQLPSVLVSTTNGQGCWWLYHPVSGCCTWKASVPVVFNITYELVLRELCAEEAKERRDPKLKCMFHPMSHAKSQFSEGCLHFTQRLRKGSVPMYT